MKTKDIAYGGFMVATYLVVSLMVRGNARMVQTYAEIAKTIVIAVFLRNIKSDAWWVFSSACFVSCLLFVSIPETFIYDVPSIIGGCVIGLQRYSNRKIRNYLSYFGVHSVMMIYEIVVFSILMQMNLFLLYKEQFSTTLAVLTGGVLNKTFVEVLFILFTIFDSAFSSFVIFILAQMVFKRLDRAIKPTDMP